MSAAFRPIRVVVVDDSALMRRLIASALSDAADIQVIGMARDAAEARELIRSADPDVVTLDVAMPGMSGIDFLRKIMQLRPMPVIMVSNLTTEGAEASLTALQIGAVDVVQKPQGAGGMDSFGPSLQAKIRLAASVGPSLRRRDGRAALRVAVPEPPTGIHTRSLVALGASTGGVSALTRLLAGLPEGMPPVVIVQHMPVGYPERLAARLRAELGRDIAEARSGERLRPGLVRFAPGSRHLSIGRSGAGFQTLIAEGPPVSGHCPSVDVLFESVARSAGARAVGVILTGMGRDGAIGLAMMRRAGAACLAQDRESCVVWGMPRAALEHGAVEEQVTLDALPQRICHHLSAAIDAPARRVEAPAGSERLPFKSS